MSGLYVYALAGGPFTPFEHAGHRIGFEDLQGGVFAAVEPRSAPPALSEAELRVQHEIAVEIARRADAVLPARFGSFVPRVELDRIIDLRRDAIREALDLVKGRAQMTIRVLGDAGQAAAVPTGKSHATDRPGTAYLRDRQAAVRSKLPPDVEAALNGAVRHLVVSVRAEPGVGTTLARLYHLIERGSEQAYRQALAPAVDALSGTTVLTTGPWPPFAFAPELWP
jgi:hypothetical protein